MARFGGFTRMAMAVSAMAVAVGGSGTAWAATAKRAVFGTLADGSKVEVITLANAKGVSARVISYGATLQSLQGPDRQGRTADVVLGYDDLDGYVNRPNFFGVTVGRYANRIAGGSFKLDGMAYTLPLNDKVNSLHGGGKGFDKVNWKVVSVKDGASASVTFAMTSPAGDSGYPGNLQVTATYALDEAGNLTIDYDARTDAPTIVNMTNHAIFNLAGEGAPQGVLEHRLTMPATRYTPVNAALIPTGEVAPVANTVFDFTTGRVLRDGVRNGHDQQIVYGRGYDHNFAIDAGLTKEPKLMARLEDPASGRVLEVLSTEPGVQMYTGNFLDGTLVGKGGHLYRMGDGIALEPQKFPDSPNQPAFASARVDPGKPYHHRMIFRLTTAN
jgi:aldose 1-epimerase